MTSAAQNPFSDAELSSRLGTTDPCEGPKLGYTNAFLILVRRPAHLKDLLSAVYQCLTFFFSLFMLVLVYQTNEVIVGAQAIGELFIYVLSKHNCLQDRLTAPAESFRDFSLR